MEYKKSAIDLTDLAIGVMVLGFTVAIGVRILVLFSSSRVTDLGTNTVTNETTPATDAGDRLAQTWVKEVSSILNISDGTTVPTTNYTTTISSTTGEGTVTFAPTSAYNGSNVRVTYDVYNLTDEQYALPQDAATGLAEYGNWFDIIVIVGIAGVILSLIFMSFGRSSSAGDVGY